MKALIVDDDRTLADLLAFTLRRAGLEPHLAFDAPGALQKFNEVPVDVVILDVNMPGVPGLKDGFDVCRQIRQISDVPMILLTVRDDEEDILRGLEIGADDYILKPFSPRQLVARVQAVLRRASSGRVEVDEPYRHKDFTFDPHRRVFFRQGQASVTLTRLEARLLGTLLLNRGQILPAENIISHVWGAEGGTEEMLRQLIRRLRLKIEINPDEPELIKNLPGIGYGIET